jgi:hypothetical protein
MTGLCEIKACVGGGKEGALIEKIELQVKLRAGHDIMKMQKAFEIESIVQ